ncbi:MAG TPA: Gfo/Idh/MocA family oxidoreductase [Acidobacteriota bacterium]|nr:Gfo/Idh/MocA family oxidoreductase [Acidobacteriota bacterium]HRV07994.1 Gfo/Idh/MocA family oxidoreductase [Acidobacteriota bacterium]
MRRSKGVSSKVESFGGGTSRRAFLRGSLGAMSAAVIPRHVLGGRGYVAANDRLAVAFVGVGSQGMRVMMELMAYPQVQAVAVCDPNRGSGDFIEWGRGELRGKVRRLLDDSTWGEGREGAWCGREVALDIVNRYYAKRSGAESYRGCTAYADFRELLERESDIDAVVVGTPDHVHAAVSVAAMRKGKHVYCQKPMCRTVHEARTMAKVAAETGAVTQVAVGNSASEATRVLAEWVAAGAVGSVREVHNWSARPFWPQGIGRPTETLPVPDYLDWDIWLGPAPARPYHPVYQPFVWRGWFDFGTGAIGDMGCYSFDTIFRVLQLEKPDLVEATGSVRWIRNGNVVEVFQNGETYPDAMTARIAFPTRGNLARAEVFWYDGGIKPPRPAELETSESLADEGMLLVGDEGKILCDFNGGAPRLLPKRRAESFSQPAKTLPRSPGHYEEWLQACRGERITPAANFEFTARVTESILVPLAAHRAKQVLRWSENRWVPENSTLQGILAPAYRDGWSL